LAPSRPRILIYFFVLLLPVSAAADSNYPWIDAHQKQSDNLLTRFPSPPSHQRAQLPEGSFSKWLRFLPVAPPSTPVKSYSGTILDVPSLGVVAMDVGDKDLQQCADSIIRLRAEYLYGQGRWRDISFHLTNGQRIDFKRWASGNRLKQKNKTKIEWVASHPKDHSHEALRSYLEKIYIWAGTASLERHATKIPLTRMAPGDFFIQGGFPGHAVLVLDMVRDKKGNVLVLLGQGFMPAQSFHVVPTQSGDAWHPVTGSNTQIKVPGWPTPFTEQSLYRFSGASMPQTDRGQLQSD
jgi:hypothetical protein